MNNQLLDALLAERVMDWRVTPERFLLGSRHWIPRWRFQPAERTADAFKLLEKAAPEDYSMGAIADGAFKVTVTIKGRIGEACETSKARAITFAIARAIGIDPETGG